MIRRLSGRAISIVLLSVFLFPACNPEERQRPVLEFGTGNPAENGSRFPYLYSEDGETLYMSWLSGIEEDMYALEYARYAGRWEDPETVRVGQNFFTNWADFPSIVTYDNEPVALHWLKNMEGGPYAYDVQIAFPVDEDRRWNHITPHDDGTATEHGFVSMIPLDSDQVLAIWLDGRSEQTMSLRSAVIHRDGRVEHERIVDSVVCDCCQTDLIAVDEGAVAVYRDRTEDEIRDISLARFDFETREWGEPVTVHQDGWEIGGCPVNGPRAAASGDRLAVAWYTEADEQKQVLTALSDDGGQTFGEPVRLNSGTAMGRVDIDVSPAGAFYISWMEHGESLARILLRKMEDGKPGTEPVVIGSTDLDRNSGFPRIAAMNEGVMMAWTQTDPVYRIRTAFYRYGDEELFTGE